MRSEHWLLLLVIAIALLMSQLEGPWIFAALGMVATGVAGAGVLILRTPGTTKSLPPSDQARSFDVHDVVKRLPTPQEVKGLTHVLEWDPDDFWALEVTAGDGRWHFKISGDRASMERRFENEERSLAAELANFRAQQRMLPEGGEAWQRWEGRIDHLGKAEHRLRPDRRWRRHSLGVEAALEEIRGGLGMPADKLRIRPLEEAEKEELASTER